MSRLSELALGQRSVVLLLAGALFVGGISAWGNLKQELLPDVDFPVVTIVAPYPGAGATDVASQVAQPIEQAIQSIPRLAELQSTSANSIALVVAQFSFGTDVQETRATIEENIRAIGLPDSVEPTVQALNINASPVIVASIAAATEDGLDVAAAIATSEIVPEIRALDGVAGADLTGGRERQIVITLDPQRMAEAGVSAQQVTGVLQANNLTVPSGQLSSDGERIPVSTIGRVAGVEEIRALVVGVRQPPMPPGEVPPGEVPPGEVPPGEVPTPITIGEVASVEQDNVATTGYGRTNGRPSLTLTVTKTSAANTVTVAESVRDALEAAQGRHVGEVNVEVVQDLSTFIEESQDGLLREGGLGAMFAILTIFLFLFSLRSTLVAAISIPLSLLAALVLMQATEISLNVMTLGGLAVAVGRVVDDSIVVLENIYRHRALGEDKLTATIRGPREVARAITSSTLTTVAVFLPIGFVGGIVSQLFLPFALTTTFALLASLVVSLTVVPVLAFLFINRVSVNVDESGEPTRSLWVRAYTPTIVTVLRNRWTKFGVLGLAALLFAGSLALVANLPTQFINTGSEKILQVVLIPPQGTASEGVLDRATEAEAILMAQPDVEIVQTSVPGEGDTGFQTIIAALQGQPANSATMTVRLNPSVDLGAATQQLSGALGPVKRDGFETNVSEAAGFTSNNLNVVVSADDPARVDVAAGAVLAALNGRADLANLKSDLVRATPEIQVTVDSNRAIAVGSTAGQIAGEVRAALTPTTATNVILEDGAEPVPIVVRLDPAAVDSLEALRSMPVGTTNPLPLEQVATVEQVDVQGSITRIDGAPAAQITAEIMSSDTGQVSRQVREEIDRLIAAGEIPVGVGVELAGVTQQQNEAFGGLYTSMALALLLVYVMMVLTFNSLVTPFIILFSVPLATVGAFAALWLTNRPIGVSALIGFLMLIGIVVTNAIVLLDLVERLKTEGRSTRDALIEGGRIRVRPILMTAFATILALIPLAAGFNEGSIIAAELGTVVIGGLFSSTFLTLIVVPVVYSLVDGGKAGVTRRFGRRTEPLPAEVPGLPSATAFSPPPPNRIRSPAPVTAAPAAVAPPPSETARRPVPQAHGPGRRLLGLLGAGLWSIARRGLGR